MSAESCDSAVRELSKIVLTLQDEVKSLKKLVIEQNSLIQKLTTSTTSTTSNALEGKQAPFLAVPTQRLGREASARAKSAIVALNRPVRTKKPTSPRIEATGGSANTDVVPSTHTSTSLCAAATQSVPTTPTTPTTPLHGDGDAFVGVISNDASIHDNVSGWTLVGKRQSRGPILNATCGTAAPGSTALQAAERKSYLHLYYVKSGTTADQVAEHLATIWAGDKCAVEALKPKGDYASFKLSVPTKNVDKYLSPQCWPADVYIKPWRSGFRSVTKQSEGENKI